MAVKRGNLQSLDLAVDAATGDERDPIYGGLSKTRRARNMTAGQRKKAAADAARNRVMVDLPEELEAVLDRIAERLSVPRSQVMTYLMLVGLGAAELDEMRDRLTASRSMRYEYNLTGMPDIPGRWKK